MRKQVLMKNEGEVVNLTEAKQFLRIDHRVDDGLISQLIGAAVEMVENHLGRGVLIHTFCEDFEPWEWGIDDRSLQYDGLRNQSRVAVHLSHGPVIHVIQVLADGVPLGRKDYFLHTDQGVGMVTLRRRPRDLIQVHYKAGLVQESRLIPEGIRQAVLHLVVQLYEHRDGALVSFSGLVGELLAPHRLVRV